MNVSSFVQGLLIGLTLLTFVPSSFAEESPGGEETTRAAGRDPAAKHKGKKKRRAHRGHRRATHK